ncbi:unnamed protein product, partial [Medioppia subpectinata]
MKGILISVNILIAIIVTLFGKSSAECLCNVRLRGEYCGSELNRRNGNNDCEKSIYFCGRNNRNKTAVLLTKCDDESECDQNQSRLTSRLKRRNACLRKLQCNCGEGMSRGPHCGNQLVGDGCPANMLFICRFNSNAVSAREVCVDGCNDGKCVNSADSSGAETPDDTNNEEESDKEP